MKGNLLKRQNLLIKLCHIIDKVTSFSEQRDEACLYYLYEESHISYKKMLTCSFEKAINAGLALLNKDYANFLSV